MKRVVCLVCSLVMALAVTLTAPAWGAEEYLPGDVLVVLKGEGGGRVSASSLDMGREAFRVASFAAASGAWVRETYPELSEAGNGVFALLRSNGRPVDELVQELLKKPEVLAVSPNYYVRLAAIPNDPMGPEDSLWGLQAINAPAAWDLVTGSRDVHVAVIDTGIDYAHPDLSANVNHELSRNFTTADTQAYRDDNGHGTHVAGIVGAVGDNGLGLVGTNWGVGLIALKAMQADGTGPISNVIAALDYLVGLLRADPGLKVAAVNLSLETYAAMPPTLANLARDPLWRALKTLDGLNRTLIVAAAGNYGVEAGTPVATGRSGVYSRGDYPYMSSYLGLNNEITVAAADRNKAITTFSNWGAGYVELAAPGSEIYSAFPGNLSQAQMDEYRAFALDDGVTVGVSSGTSMAAPYVSGAAALLMSQDPTRTAYQIRTALLQGADHTRCQGTVGWGMLDVKGSLDYQAANPDLQATPPASEYDNYESYANNNSSSGNSGWGDGSGGSGCDAAALSGAWLLLLICPRLRGRRDISG